MYLLCLTRLRRAKMLIMAPLIELIRLRNATIAAHPTLWQGDKNRHLNRRWIEGETPVQRAKGIQTLPL
jgi:hypothetical protein